MCSSPFILILNEALNRLLIIFQSVCIPSKKEKRQCCWNAGHLTNRKSVQYRSIEIEKWTRFDDLEINTIVGKKHQHALVPMVDRKIGYFIVEECRSGKLDKICQAAIHWLEPIKVHLSTLSTDNAKEFSLHDYVTRELDWYFADPDSAWKRGTNEHTNGLIKQ